MNVVLEPPDTGRGFLVALKGHNQGHLLITKGRSGWLGQYLWWD